MYRHVGSENPVSSSMSQWIDKLLSVRLTPSEKTTTLFSHFYVIVQQYGDIFKGRRPTPEEEEQHFLYYYGDIVYSVASGKGFFMEESSPEWISTALCLFALSVKYVAMKTSHHGHGGMDQYLSSYTLDNQARKCKRFLNAIKEPTRNPFQISSDHRLAYDMIFRGICRNCPENQLSAKQKSENFMDPTNSGFVAAVHFMKGITSVIVTMDDINQEARDCFQAAREKEPGYFFWWYNIVHRNRLRVNHEVVQALGGYVYMTECATTAHELAPDVMKLRTGLSKLMIEREMAKVKGEYYLDSSMAQDSLQLLYEKAKSEQADPSELHKKWASIRVSQLMIQNAFSLEQEGKGRDLLQECFTASTLCHLTLGALAVLYDNGSLPDDTSLLLTSELYSKAKQIYPSTKVNQIFNFDKSMLKAKTRDKKNPTSTTKGLDAAIQEEVISQSVTPIPKRGNGGGPGDPNDWQLLIADLPIESPPVWLARDVARIRPFSIQEAGSLSAYLRAKLKAKEFVVPHYKPATENRNNNASDKDEDQDDDQETVEAASPATGTGNPGQHEISEVDVIWCAAKICTGSLALYLNEMELSISTLENCTEGLKGSSMQNRYKRYRKAHEYLIQSSIMCIELLKNQYSNVAMNDKMRKSLNSMQKSWQSVQTSPPIIFMRGRIADLLGLVHDIALDQYRKAIDLEPGFYLWHQILYQKLGQMRKSGSNLNAPGREEIEACQRVHQLCPNKLVYILDLATLKMQSV